MIDEVPAETFEDIGRAIANRAKCQCREYELRRFKAFFGCNPARCAQLWWMLFKTKAAKDEIGENARPVHLLWGLLFLKIYNTDTVMTGMTGADEDTFRKWSWKFVVGISKLKEKVVSRLLIILVLIRPQLSSNNSFLFDKYADQI